MKRFKEIDVLKSIGIILMIMGHQYYGEFFDKWIHAFHMPMFFIISGFLYHRPISYKKTCTKKIKTLLIPYAFFAVIHFLIISVKTLLYGQSIEVLLNYLYHILGINTEGLPICGAIWFLTALFFTELIYLLIDKYTRRYLKVVCVFVILISGLILAILGYRLLLAVDVAFVGVGLFFVGENLRKVYDKFPSLRSPQMCIWGMVGVLVCIITINMNKMVNLRLGLYGNVILFFANASIMTVSLYYLCNIISKYEGAIVRELSFIGKNSITFFK